MNLLLDTHVAIWAVLEPHRISGRITRLVQGAHNVAYVSTVSIWEISIKFGLGRKRGMPFSGAAAIVEFEAAGFQMLNVLSHHAAAVDDLPPIHGDPFDRLILAQALSEPMRLITRDAKLAAYSDTVITW
jgi:PIN domain nuclease of toxin-antitoxin system